MTVEDLIEQLKAMPPTAMVYCIQYEDLEMAVEGADYLRGVVVLATEPLEDELPAHGDGAPE